MNFTKELEVAKSTAIKAGELAVQMRKTLNQIVEKNPKDLVTEADLACDLLIRKEIQTAFPDHGMITEEGQDINPTSEYQWYIDPIDGTANYAAGLTMWGVSIAMEYQGVLQIGVVFCPMLDQFFYGLKGSGSFCNNQRLQVSKESDLKTAMVVNNGINLGKTLADQNSYNAKWFNLIGKIAPAIGRTRNLGAAVCESALVALGNAVGYAIMGYNSWDVAAMVLIVEEAGGKCSSLEGGPFQLRDSGKGGLMTNTLVHEQLLAAINS